MTAKVGLVLYIPPDFDVDAEANELCWDNRRHFVHSSTPFGVQDT